MLAQAGVYSAEAYVDFQHACAVPAVVVQLQLCCCSRSCWYWSVCMLLLGLAVFSGGFSRTCVGMAVLPERCP